MSLLLTEIPPKIILHLAGKNESINIIDLSFEMGIAQSQLSLAITKLSTHGLVSSDKVSRMKFVHLTSKGEKAASILEDLIQVIST